MINTALEQSLRGIHIFHYFCFVVRLIIIKLFEGSDNCKTDVTIQVALVKWK